MQPATRLRFRLSPRFFYPTGRNPIGYIIFFNFNFLYIRYTYTHGHTPMEFRKKLRVAGCVYFTYAKAQPDATRNLQLANVFTFYLKHLDVLKQTP